jgi:hypothetical protein
LVVSESLPTSPGDFYGAVHIRHENVRASQKEPKRFQEPFPRVSALFPTVTHEKPSRANLDRAQLC